RAVGHAASGDVWSRGNSARGIPGEVEVGAGHPRRLLSSVQGRRQKARSKKAEGRRQERAFAGQRFSKTNRWPASVRSSLLSSALFLLAFCLLPWTSELRTVPTT